MTSSVCAICRNSPPSSERKTRYLSASATELQTKATGEVTFGALSDGTTSMSGAALQSGGSGMVKVSRFDATAGQPSKMLSTNQVPLPGASFF